MERIRNLILMLLLSVFLGGIAQAAVAVDFSLSDWTVSGGTVTCDIAGPFTATDTIAAGIVSARITSVGLTPGGSGNYPGELNFSSWNQLGNNDRLAIEITVADGMQADLTGLTLNLARNGSAAPQTLNVSLAADDVVIDSITGFAVRSGSLGALPATGYEHTFDLSSAPNQSGTFTLWIKTPDGDKVGNLRINNIVVEASVFSGTSLTITNLAPANFLTGLDLTPVLRWEASNADQPDFVLNMGTDPDCDDLIQGRHLGNVSSFAVEPNTLDYAVTYYWRIDAIDGGIEYPGDVWQFTTIDGPPNFRVIDDFNNYIDTDALLASWSPNTDAVATEDLSGSMKIHFADLAQVTKQFTVAQNWTDNSMALLSFFIRGYSGNTNQPVYVSLTDPSGPQTVVCRRVSTAVQAWQQVYLKLSDFTDQGLDLTQVQSITLGIGDNGASGDVYIDDIVLYQNKCVRQLKPDADINFDCRVDSVDLMAIVQCWLATEDAVKASAPTSANLLAHYRFDGNAEDSSGNDYHAALQADDPAAVWAPGYENDCLRLDPSVMATFPEAVFANVGDQLTIAMWIKTAADNDSADISRFQYRASDSQAGWDIDALDDNWHHFAVTVNAAGTVRTYFDGVLMSRTDGASPLMTAGAGTTILSADAIQDIHDTATDIDELMIYADCLSQEQIVYLAKGPTGIIMQTISPEYDICDLTHDGTIGLDDFALISNDWLAQ